MTGAFGMVETHLRGKRILLVDDERELADMVATILHGAGFASVNIANSSAEALSSIAARIARWSSSGICRGFVTISQKWLHSRNNSVGCVSWK